MLLVEKVLPEDFVSCILHDLCLEIVSQVFLLLSDLGFLLRDESLILLDSPLMMILFFLVNITILLELISESLISRLLTRGSIGKVNKFLISSKSRHCL